MTNDMTKDEALEILRTSLRKAKRWGELCEVDERSMQEIIAALSSPCACGGRKPIATVEDEAWLGQGSFGPQHYHLRINCPRGKHRTAALRVYVLVFADGPQGGTPE